MSFSDIQSGASRAAKSVGGFLGGAAEFAWGTAKLVSALAVEVPVKALYAHRDDITKTAASVGSAAKRSLNELRIDVTNPFSSDGKTTLKEGCAPKLKNRFTHSKNVGLPELEELDLRSNAREQISRAEIERVERLTEEAATTLKTLASAFCTFNFVLSFFPHLARIDGEDKETAFLLTHFAYGANDTSLKDIFYQFFQPVYIRRRQQGRNIQFSIIDQIKIHLLFLISEKYMQSCAGKLINEVTRIIRTSLSDREKFSDYSRRVLANTEYFLRRSHQEMQRCDDPNNYQHQLNGTKEAHFMGLFNQESSPFFPTDDQYTDFTNPKSIAADFAQVIKNFVPPISFRAIFVDSCQIYQNPQNDIEKAYQVAINIIIAIPALILAGLDWTLNRFIIPHFIDAKLPTIIQSVFAQGVNQVYSNNYTYACNQFFRELMQESLENFDNPQNINPDPDSLIPQNLMRQFVSTFLAVVDDRTFEENADSNERLSDDASLRQGLTESITSLLSQIHLSMTHPLQIEKLLTNCLNTASKPFVDGRNVSNAALEEEQTTLKQVGQDLVEKIVAKKVVEAIEGPDEVALIRRFASQEFQQVIEEWAHHYFDRLQHVDHNLKETNNEEQVQRFDEMQAILDKLLASSNQKVALAERVSALPEAFVNELRETQDRISEEIQSISRETTELQDRGRELNLFIQLNNLWSRIQERLTVATENRDGFRTLTQEDLLNLLSDRDQITEIRDLLNQIQLLEAEHVDIDLRLFSDLRASFSTGLDQAISQIEQRQKVIVAERALADIQNFEPGQESALNTIINAYQVAIEQNSQRNLLQRGSSYVQHSLGREVVLSRELQSHRSRLIRSLRANATEQEAQTIQTAFSALSDASTIEEHTGAARQLRDSLNTLERELTAQKTALEQNIQQSIANTHESRSNMLRFYQEAEERSEISLETRIDTLEQGCRELIDSLVDRANEVRSAAQAIQVPNRVLHVGLHSGAQAATWVALTYFTGGTANYIGGAVSAAAIREGYNRLLKPGLHKAAMKGRGKTKANRITDCMRAAFDLMNNRSAFYGTASTGLNTVNQIAGSVNSG